MDRLSDSDRLKRQTYLKRAEDADARAAATEDAYLRESWKQIATAYRDMAERLARKR
jgi:hypothetical protein